MSSCCGKKSSNGRVAVQDPSKIESTELVQPWSYKPSNGIRPDSRINLSCLDECTAPIMTIHLPFFFRSNLDPSILRTALSITLDSFPIFAGRLQTATDNTGHLEIKLNGKGASFSVASSSARLSDIIPKAPSATAEDIATGNGSDGFNFRPVDVQNLYSHDAPRNILGYLNKDTPLLHAQLTSLTGGGCCLSATFLHALVDLESCKLVMTLWGKHYTEIQKEAAENANKQGSTTILKADNSTLLPKDSLRQVSTTRAQKQQQENSAVDDMNLGNSADTNTSSTKQPLNSISSFDADTIVGVQAIYGREALLLYTATSLPPNYVSANFERRTFGTIPRLLGSAIWHVAIPGGVETIAYHVPTTRLAALKSEAGSGLVCAGVKNYVSAGWISTMDALVARIWQVVSEAKTARSSSKKSSSTNNSITKPSPFYLSMELRRRMVPRLPAATIGNCVWSVPLELPPEVVTNTPTTSSIKDTTTSASSSGGPSTSTTQPPGLGMMAGAVRCAIQSLNTDLISKELKWLELQHPEIDPNTSKATSKGSLFPSIIKGAANVLPEGGAVVVSPWDWGADYSSVRFGSGGIDEGAVVWHQPPFSRGPNVVFIVPAPRGLPGGGYVVHLTLHKTLAEEMRSRCRVL